LVLAFAESFDVVGYVVILSLFCKSAKAEESASIVEEAETHVELGFIQIRESLPNVLSHYVPLALL
jgi:hypothetical protein